MTFSFRVFTSSALVLALALLSCQSPGPVSIAAQVNSPAASDYEEVLNNYTRRDHVYDFFADKVDLRATFHSPAFVQAFTAAKAQFHGRSAELIDLYLHDQKPAPSPLQSLSSVVKPFNKDADVKADAPAKTLNFLLAFYVSDQDYRSLDADDSIWDIELRVDDKEPLKPLNIERLRRDPSLDQVYPYLNKLDQIYWLRFSATDADGQPVLESSARKMQLRVVSKIADAKLLWKFEN